MFVTLREKSLSLFAGRSLANSDDLCRFNGLRLEMRPKSILGSVNL